MTIYGQHCNPERSAKYGRDKDTVWLPFDNEHEPAFISQSVIETWPELMSDLLVEYIDSDKEPLN